MDEIIRTLVTTIYGTGQLIFDFFTLSINGMIDRIGLEITVPVFGEWSFIGIMFGGGIILYLAYTIVKWILDIIP